MDIVKGFLQVMVANMFLRRDLYGFLEPFAPIIDETTFSQQPIDAFIVSWNFIYLIEHS